MTYGEKLAHIFQMNDKVWENHANPWSVWTRYLGLPLLVISVWSRIWWGWWSILPITMVMIWIWINPRIFPKPKTTQNWSSKAVLGERVWLNQKEIPIPQHHQNWFYNLCLGINKFGNLAYYFRFILGNFR